MTQSSCKSAKRWFSLRTMLPCASFVGTTDIRYCHVTENSRDCQKGSLFVAMAGSHSHGKQFLKQAIENGACGVLIDHPLPDVSIPQCIAPNVRNLYGKLCQQVWGSPAQRLTLTAVTGTNGKTTTTWLLRSILKAAGQKTALLGTIENDNGAATQQASMTTLDCANLAQWMHQAVENQCQHLILETSSHALTQGRLSGLEFDTAVMTNITRDHLDYHGTFADYLAAKISLLDYLSPSGKVIVNWDDHWLYRVFQHSPYAKNVRPFGARAQFTQVQLTPVKQSFTGTEIDLGFKTQDSSKIHRHRVRVPLIGKMNLENVWAAAETALAMNISPEALCRGLENFQPAAGRLENIPNSQGIHVFVDYAHTPDAMTAVLQALRPLCTARLICVFGAGGNRDQGKRASMGKAACLADHLILTNDNPRHEDPQEILSQIQAGISPEIPTHIQTDREAAIAQAIRMAEPGDCVLLLGKGHETTQQIGHQKLPFNDAELATTLLASSAATHSSRIPA